MDIIAKSLIWRFLSWLPRFFLRTIFTDEHLASLTEIDVRARGEQAVFNCRELPHVKVWLEIRNHNHFKIELDRLVLEILFNSKFCELSYLHRELINPGESKVLLVEGLISDRHVESLLNLKDKYQCSIKAIAYFNNKIHNFKVDTKTLQGVQAQFQGEKQREQGNNINKTRTS